MADIPFWQRKRLEDMTATEWESLCDGCGLCCLTKLQDGDTGEVFYTDLSCPLMDTATCRCRNYEQRQQLVPDCTRLTPENVREFDWLPTTCAYRTLAEGRPLPDWHPLRSGSPDTVHKAGISAANRATPSNQVAVEVWQEHIIRWVL